MRLPSGSRELRFVRNGASPGRADSKDFGPSVAQPRPRATWPVRRPDVMRSAELIVKRAGRHTKGASGRLRAAQGLLVKANGGVLFLEVAAPSARDSAQAAARAHERRVRRFSICRGAFDARVVRPRSPSGPARSRRVVREDCSTGSSFFRSDLPPLRDAVRRLALGSIYEKLRAVRAHASSADSGGGRPLLAIPPLHTCRSSELFRSAVSPGALRPHHRRLSAIMRPSPLGGHPTSATNEHARASRCRRIGALPTCFARWVATLPRCARARSTEPLYRNLKRYGGTRTWRRRADLGALSCIACAIDAQHGQRRLVPPDRFRTFRMC